MPSKADITEFDHDYMPMWCEGCNEQGYIFDKDVFTRAFFVICPKCSRETSSVNCLQCETGGEFVENIATRPDSWTCPICNTSHSLPTQFYNKPKSLYLESDLPEKVLARVSPKGGAAPAGLNVLVLIILIIGMPLLIGAGAAFVLDIQMIVFSACTAMISAIMGLVSPLSRQQSLKNWLGILAISLSPLICILTGWMRPPQAQALVISFVLGALYGLALAQFLIWYNARITNIGLQKSP